MIYQVKKIFFYNLVYFDHKIPGKIKFYFDMYFQLFVLMLFLTNNKGRPIPTPKSYPIQVNKVKIIYSNKLIQNEENTYHLIQYTDNNGNIVMLDSTIEDNLYIFFILLRLFASIAIIFFIVPKLIYNEQNETFVLVILGDKFRQPNESNNEKKLQSMQICGKL